ncbi:MAG: hypothetical protein HQ559_06560 [Lentisphaerae bacterium]|nr:hypothetical protein [Lentisphaerota bacterium]
MIGAYRGKSLPSIVIKFRTWSPYSHVAEIDDFGGGVIEAWRGGVTERASYHEGHKPGTVIELYDVVGVEGEKRQAIRASLKAEIGAKYDHMGILGFAIRKDLERPSKWFCSEIIFAKYAEHGIRLLERIAAHKVSPGLVVLSPRLIFVGELVVGQDTQLIGKMPVREIAQIRHTIRRSRPVLVRADQRVYFRADLVPRGGHLRSWKHAVDVSGRI